MTGPIGGFFELEIRSGAGPYHHGAVALHSGRACLRLILESRRPRRVWVPFYVCDAALQACSAAGIPAEFYAIDSRFDPVLPPGAPGPGESLLYVNYFGLKTATARALVAAHSSAVIIDDTQAFFVRGYSGAPSFNSARKFFGVPDGAYAYGRDLPSQYPAPPEVRYDHLVSRLTGLGPVAYEQYVRNETLVTPDLWRVSAFSERLLAGIDYDTARCRRTRNFAALHERLGDRNGLPPELFEDGIDGPFCYPLLATDVVPWNDLWQREAFVPRLWPEIPARPGTAQFGLETRLSERLMPLPIDHRYGIEDLDRLSAIVREVMGW